ncbi:MAG: cysteine--tRNA ligase [Coriobacteriales bacterium]|nr:cysteine--tRNA ligase [Coriobacteriales bacterium]
MRLYNTLSRQKEEFVPLVSGKIGFYVCGPTVYNHIHIGNARTFISFDVIRRYLEYRGFEVCYVQNLTDIDDKIINRAHEEKRSPAQVAAEYSEAFISVMRDLGIADPTIRPRATDEIETMIELISCLIEQSHAYQSGGDVYYAVRSFAEYGALSGRDIDQLLAGARVEVLEGKHDPLDFTLWKAAKPGEPAWDSPWGPGRPGWHIECSAMSMRYLGSTFDIHGGGDDLIFPHHENEIAQSEGCGHDGFARYWLHGGMLTIDSEKMSKSEGNFLLLKDVLTHVQPQALRLLMLQTHYRSSFDYSPERLEEAKAALDRIETSLRNLEWLLGRDAGVGAAADVGAGASASADGAVAATDAAVIEGADAAAGTTAAVVAGAVAGAAVEGEDAVEGATAATSVAAETVHNLRSQTKETEERFIQQMDDDFNTAGAIAAVYDLVGMLNKALAQAVEKPVVLAGAPELRQALAEAGECLTTLLAVLGIDLTAGAADGTGLPAGLVGLAAELLGFSGADAAEAAALLLEARAKARAAKDWAQADAIRDGITALGLTIEDTASGPRLIKA